MATEPAACDLNILGAVGTSPSCAMLPSKKRAGSLSEREHNTMGPEMLLCVDSERS